ncbi:MAG: hypothetical protein ACK5YV_11710, partial [Betaproteobacteria bacterium]
MQEPRRRQEATSGGPPGRSRGTTTAPCGAVVGLPPERRGQATAASTSAMSAALISFSMSTRIS